MPSNRAVFQDEAGVPSVIRETPYPSTIENHQLVIRCHAWAINPADPVVQSVPLPFISYPVVLGEDIAGEVVQVGSIASSKFEEGDRVLAYALGTSTKTNSQGAFQEYVIINSPFAVKILDGMSFAEGAVFPLGLVTAAAGLFSRFYLDIPMPKISKDPPAAVSKTVLIWGGSSSVGCNAIQLAKAAGYTVVTTCSAHNFDLVKSLGADTVYDYNSASVIDDIVSELDSSTCIGIYQAAGGAAGMGVGPPCQVAAKSKQSLYVVTTNFIVPGSVPEGVKAKMMGMDADMEELQRDVVVPIVQYLQQALDAGTYRVAPRPEIVETKGLEGIQGAMDMVRKGVSARKIVVVAE